MAAAPAYRYDYDYDYGYPAAQPRPYRAQVAPVPSRGLVQRLDPRWYTVARVLVVIAVIFALAGAIRIQLNTAALAASTEYEQVAESINVARAQGSELEVQTANLSNPAYVKEYAAQHLSMAAPATVETMTLGADVVAVDESGQLSLSRSLAAVSGR